MHDQSRFKTCFYSWSACISYLTCFDVSQHSFQLFNADFDFVSGFLSYNFVCFLSFVFVIQFVVVVGNVPTTGHRFEIVNSSEESENERLQYLAVCTNIGWFLFSWCLAMWHLFCCCIIQGVSFNYHHRNVRSRVSVSNFQVSVSAFMTKSRSRPRLEIWARSWPQRLRSRLYHWSKWIKCSFKSLVKPSVLNYPWAQFVVKCEGDSLVWDQHSHRDDAEWRFIYRVSILFLEVFWKQH